MPILAKDESEFQKLKLPESGTVQAVCCAVWDVGIQPTPFTNGDGKPKSSHKVVVAWELAEKINDPSSSFNELPYMLSKTYTISLNEKSNLRKDLESWRGKGFTEEEIKAGFDLERLVGANCLLGVTHAAKTNGREYANITAILPLAKGTEKLKVTRPADEKPPRWVTEMRMKAIGYTEEPPVEDEFPGGGS